MKDYFSLSFNNLKRRKTRSWLTMIGIFIGIAAVVALISLGQGLQDSIEEQFQNLGVDKIIIEPKSIGSPGSVTSQELLLTSEDLEFIENVNGIDWAMGYLIKTDLIKFKDESKVEYIGGLEADDMELNLEMQGIEIKEGRNLEEGDNYRVVLGYNHGQDKKIWERGIEVGENIEIGDNEFKVIGILESVGNPFDDAIVYMLKDTLKEIANVEDEETQILAKVADGENVTQVAETVERKLRQERGEEEGQETFNVQTSEQFLSTFTNIFGVVQAVLVGIASISLLVGGIGIANTMYTSVLERTKEIGTMKAVGAKNSDILILFLIESGMLGLIGGIIGVIIGIGLSKTAEYIATSALGTNLLQASLNPMIIFGALAFSFFIGAISGVFPAYQASKLKPVDALRYE